MYAIPTRSTQLDSRVEDYQDGMERMADIIGDDLHALKLSNVRLVWTLAHPPSFDTITLLRSTYCSLVLPVVF